MNLASSTSVKTPLFLDTAAAGFPSPADDFIDQRLDLNEYLIKHPVATFFIRASGNSMIKAGINSGDLLIVDRALEPQQGSIVVAAVNGEITIKRIHMRENRLFLKAENPNYHSIKINTEMDFKIWGVVTYIIANVH